MSLQGDARMNLVATNLLYMSISVELPYSLVSTRFNIATPSTWPV